MRMIQLADEFFETKNDPSQLDITEAVMKQLRSIHPSTMGERANEEGPVAWTIVIPTTRSTREKFVKGEIGEGEMLSMTLSEHERHLQGDADAAHTGQFTSLYLCSALVLPEFRGKGIAKNLTLESIRAIRTEHPIDELFVWAFSREGNALAERIAAVVKLPLFCR